MDQPFQTFGYGYLSPSYFIPIASRTFLTTDGGVTARAPLMVFIRTLGTSDRRPL